MPPRPRIPPELRAAVRERAGLRCEYCHALEAWQYVEFTLDHIRPISSGGETTLGNLALACLACNRRKWDCREAKDPETGEVSRLFNPRTDRWNEHFMWSRDGVEIVGASEVGRATVVLLELNRERALRIREADAALGRHPPGGDRRM